MNYMIRLYATDGELVEEILVDRYVSIDYGSTTIGRLTAEPIVALEAPGCADVRKEDGRDKCYDLRCRRCHAYKSHYGVPPRPTEEEYGSLPILNLDQLHGAELEANMNAEDVAHNPTSVATEGEQL